jgi:endoglucanase
LIVYKKGTCDKNLLLCAHMDEVGLRVNFIDDNGFLRFICVGGIDVRTLLAQRVRLQTKAGPVLGVIGTKPAHITTEADRTKAVGLKELFIDTGLPAYKVKELIPVGTTAVLDRAYEEFGKHKITAKALDNRAGVFVLAELLRNLKNPFYNVYAVFTTQEEVGLRGAVTAAYGIKADIALSLDTTGAADIPACLPQDYIIRLGEGVGITICDAYTIGNPQLVEALREICEQNEIHYQMRVASRGGNDAGAVHLSKTGVRTCALSLPTRNIHSNVEIVSKNDLQDMFGLALHVAQNEIMFKEF